MNAVLGKYMYIPTGDGTVILFQFGMSTFSAWTALVAVLELGVQT